MRPDDNIIPFTASMQQFPAAKRLRIQKSYTQDGLEWIAHQSSLRRENIQIREWPIKRERRSSK